MNRTMILAIVITLLITLSANADVYKYIDNNGSVVITDDVGKIPLNKRSQVQQSGIDSVQRGKQSEEQRGEASATNDKTKDDQDNKKYMEMMEKQYGIKFKETCQSEAKTEIIEELKSVWQRMAQRLTEGDIEAALREVSVFTRDSMRRKLSGFSKEKLSNLLNIKGLELESFRENNRIANCGLIREEPGGTFSYPIHFVRDPDCVWRISSF